MSVATGHSGCSPAAGAPQSRADRMLPILPKFRMPRPDVVSSRSGQLQRDDSTFQARNDSSSMIVVWATSCPGKIPHVTAFLAWCDALLCSSPFKHGHFSSSTLDRGVARSYLYIRRVIINPSVALFSYLPLNFLKVLLLDETLNEAFLVHVPAPRTPPDYLVCRAGAVDRGLRSDGPPAMPVQSLEVLNDHEGLWREWGGRERCGGDLGMEVAQEHSREVV